jgi:hypothetical protein
MLMMVHVAGERRPLLVAGSLALIVVGAVLYLVLN